MKLDEIYKGTSLKADDMGDKDHTLTINHWETTEFKEEDGYERTKLVLGFAETDRTFVVNKTNAMILSELIGSSDTDDWTGAKVTIGKGRTMFRGNMVDCIKVKGATPPKGVSTPAEKQYDETDTNEVPF